MAAKSKKSIWKYKSHSKQHLEGEVEYVYDNIVRN
jgi:hypothetical protein